eukprot:MONOS_5284.1-p1 / transcript=MONOS_5284.1 / gene=MONOS_5284 / organism=Monocercomonoides_exilis_PA203 / gene_product=unspecified product / transcript_product=unspecified product / location=Mono_scaffold00152:21389-26772(-) / protein_length=1733 / sequence_SO=supercontig / SO=protein_coding / is_pseudo=false
MHKITFIKNQEIEICGVNLLECKDLCNFGTQISCVNVLSECQQNSTVTCTEKCQNGSCDISSCVKDVLLNCSNSYGQCILKDQTKRGFSSECSFGCKQKLDSCEGKAVTFCHTECTNQLSSLLNGNITDTEKEDYNNKLSQCERRCVLASIKDCIEPYSGCIEACPLKCNHPSHEAMKNAVVKALGLSLFSPMQSISSQSLLLTDQVDVDCDLTCRETVNQCIDNCDGRCDPVCFGNGTKTDGADASQTAECDNCLKQCEAECSSLQEDCLKECDADVTDSEAVKMCDRQCMENTKQCLHTAAMDCYAQCEEEEGKRDGDDDDDDDDDDEEEDDDDDDDEDDKKKSKEGFSSQETQRAHKVKRHQLVNKYKQHNRHVQPNKKRTCLGRCMAEKTDSCGALMATCHNECEQAVVGNKTENQTKQEEQERLMLRDDLKKRGIAKYAADKNDCVASCNDTLNSCSTQMRDYCRSECAQRKMKQTQTSDGESADSTSKQDAAQYDVDESDCLITCIEHNMPQCAEEASECVSLCVQTFNAPPNVTESNRRAEQKMKQSGLNAKSENDRTKERKDNIRKRVNKMLKEEKRRNGSGSEADGKNGPDKKVTDGRRVDAKRRYDERYPNRAGVHSNVSMANSAGGFGEERDEQRSRQFSDDYHSPRYQVKGQKIDVSERPLDAFMSRRYPLADRFSSGMQQTDVEGSDASSALSSSNDQSATASSSRSSRSVNYKPDSESSSSSFSDLHSSQSNKRSHPLSSFVADEFSEPSVSVNLANSADEANPVSASSSSDCNSTCKDESARCRVNAELGCMMELSQQDLDARRKAAPGSIRYNQLSAAIAPQELNQCLEGKLAECDAKNEQCMLKCRISVGKAQASFMKVSVTAKQIAKDEEKEKEEEEEEKKEEEEKGEEEIEEEEEEEDITERLNRSLNKFKNRRANRQKTDTLNSEFVEISPSSKSSPHFASERKVPPSSPYPRGCVKDIALSSVHALHRHERQLQRALSQINRTFEECADECSQYETQCIDDCHDSSSDSKGWSKRGMKMSTLAQEWRSRDFDFGKELDHVALAAELDKAKTAKKTGKSEKGDSNLKDKAKSKAKERGERLGTNVRKTLLRSFGEEPLVTCVQECERDSATCEDRCHRQREVMVADVIDVAEEKKKQLLDNTKQKLMKAASEEDKHTRTDRRMYQLADLFDEAMVSAKPSTETELKQMRKHSRYEHRDSFDNSVSPVNSINKKGTQKQLRYDVSSGMSGGLNFDRRGMKSMLTNNSVLSESDGEMMCESQKVDCLSNCVDFGNSCLERGRTKEECSKEVQREVKRCDAEFERCIHSVERDEEEKEEEEERREKQEKMQKRKEKKIMKRRMRKMGSQKQTGEGESQANSQVPPSSAPECEMQRRQCYSECRRFTQRCVQRQMKGGKGEEEAYQDCRIAGKQCNLGCDEEWRACEIEKEGKEDEEDKDEEEKEKEEEEEEEEEEEKEEKEMKKRMKSRRERMEDAIKSRKEKVGKQLKKMVDNQKGFGSNSQFDQRQNQRYQERGPADMVRQRINRAINDKMQGKQKMQRGEKEPTEHPKNIVDEYLRKMNEKNDELDALVGSWDFDQKGFEHSNEEESHKSSHLVDYFLKKLDKDSEEIKSKLPSKIKESIKTNRTTQPLSQKYANMKKKAMKKQRKDDKSTGRDSNVENKNVNKQDKPVTISDCVDGRRRCATMCDRDYQGSRECLTQCEELAKECLEKASS